MINARCDVFFLGQDDARGRFAEAVRRCEAYIRAGADCVYPFGLSDPATIAAFAEAVDAPVNVTGRPGMPDAAALEQMGVARITIAAAPALVAMAAVRQVATDLMASRGFGGLASSLRHPDAQKLFAEAAV